MGKAVDITGQRFGRLVAVEPTDTRAKSGDVFWKCKCDCGNIAKVITGSLTTGGTKSCGCLQRDVVRKIFSGESGREIQKKNIENFCKEGTKLNNLTMGISKINTSGVKGVGWYKNAKKWRAHIGFQGKDIHLGLFDNLEDATLARKEAEEKYFAPILEKYGFVEK